MRFEDNQTYWVLLAATKFSGVPTYARNTGIPTAGRTTSINDAKRFASRDEAIEWGNHLNFGVYVRRVTETRTYVMTEEK